MFCPNCGNEIQNENGICPNCNPVPQPTEQPVEQPTFEQPVEQPTFEQPMEQPTFEQPAYEQPVYEQPVYEQTKNGKGKLMLILGGVVALVLVVVLLFVLLGGGGAEGVATDYVEAAVDGDMEALLDCTPANLDYDQLCDRAKPIDKKDYQGDNEYDKAMCKALSEADADDFAEVMDEFLRQSLVATYGGEVEVENIRVRLTVERDKNNEVVASDIDDYNEEIEELRDRLGSNADLLQDATIRMSDVDEAQTIYIAYEIDSEKEGEDETDIKSCPVIKINGSWKVLSVAEIEMVMEVAGLLESVDDYNDDLYY